MLMMSFTFSAFVIPWWDKVNILSACGYNSRGLPPTSRGFVLLTYHCEFACATRPCLQVCRCSSGRTDSRKSFPCREMHYTYRSDTKGLFVLMFSPRAGRLRNTFVSHEAD